MYLKQGGDENYQWQTTWQILQCRGCEHVFVRTVSTNSEDYDNFYNELGEEDGEYRETIQYWPSLAKRPQPDWLTAVGVEGAEGEELSEVMMELYKALDDDLYILAVIGIRTVFDAASKKLERDDFYRNRF